MTQSRLAPRMRSVGISPTAEISNKVRAAQAAGFTVTNLGEGELDFATPEPIADAGIRAIRAGDTKYTAVSGTAALKAAIAAKFERENGLSYKADEIIAGTGAKQLLFNAFLATLAEGDEVIVPAPYWVSYPDMVRLAGGVPVIVGTRRSERWILTAQALEAAITPQTRWVVLNSPNNPTGSVYSPAEMAALTEVLERHPQVMVMADDIYEHVRYGGAFATPAAVAPALGGRTLTVNGLSKGYSMTGWRIGYAGGPSWLISAMDVLQSQSTSNPSSISQAAAVAALSGGLGFMEGWLQTLEQRREIVMRMIDGVDGLEADTPDGAFYVFAECTGLIGSLAPDGRILRSDLDVATFLLEEARVALVHGSAFGMPGHLRIAYAVETKTLQDACRRIAAAVARLQIRKAA
ncbi:pyridoxal phosphate-dependent aminotransferase [Jiella sonneratiae]|uniref:Aminotransferase n=1 Tax=Jiella sonneratiae TaxID=2816856 RepID=A0ABS3J597_9HYPH|nr:pyridoxal phosphate-dependent aminotransferase [Jiella sonneratiae]MBO0904827.1 pyridoxal phosphate-dependent aminotransferase [Jiella sonneratiae]